MLEAIEWWGAASKNFKATFSWTEQERDDFDLMTISIQTFLSNDGWLWKSPVVRLAKDIISFLKRERLPLFTEHTHQ